jgi:hypothetical protein
MRFTRCLVAASTTAVLLAATGCGGGKDTPGAKETPLPTKPEAEITQLVKSYADTAATTVGGPLQKWETVAAPCVGRTGETATDGRWSLTGHANIPLARDQHVAVLTHLRDQWKQQGYEITEFRTFPPDNKTGALIARNPQDHISISLESDGPGTSFAVLIATPCYKPAPGEHPAG